MSKTEGRRHNKLGFALAPMTIAQPALATALLRWYDRERRDLPWRRQPTPYHTLVSELMLRQTVVATVVPHFRRFVRRFADLSALAAAPEEQVLASWSGLRYYARARNLHRAARAVVADHGGAVPGGRDCPARTARGTRVHGRRGGRHRLRPAHLRRGRQRVTARV